MNKVNILFLLVIVLCWIGKVQSQEKKEATSGTPTKEEPANATKKVQETQEVDIKETDEYKRFIKALENTKDNACLDHLIILALNLFHANQTDIVNCNNSYDEKLKSYRKTQPCKENKNKKYQYAVEYMDNHIQLLCHEYAPNKNVTDVFLEGENKKLCPLINTLKSSNSTVYEESLIKSCKNASNSTLTDGTDYGCTNNMLKNYKTMEDIYVNKLKKDQSIYIDFKKDHNVTLNFKIDFDESIYEKLNSCDHYKYEITAGAVSISISFTTILIFSIFIIFINM